MREMQYCVLCALDCLAAALFTSGGGGGSGNEHHSYTRQQVYAYSKVGSENS